MNIDEINKIIQLEHSLMNYVVASNHIELDDVISNDFVEFGSSGKVWDKESIVSMLKSKTKCKNLKMENTKTRKLCENTVLLTYKVSHYDEYRNITRTVNRSSIWKLSGGFWKLEFHQGTNVPHS